MDHLSPGSLLSLLSLGVDAAAGADQRRRNHGGPGGVREPGTGSSRREELRKKALVKKYKLCEIRSYISRNALLHIEMAGRNVTRWNSCENSLGEKICCAKYVAVYQV